MQRLAASPAPVPVTITSGVRRVDLLLPASVPVAELLPELARSVGLLDAAMVHEGCRLVTVDGRELLPEHGLAGQGVREGALLTVTSGPASPPPRVYDDVVEAMAEVVERDVRRWTPAAQRRTALGSVALVHLLAAGALWLQRGSVPAAAVAALSTALLLAVAVVLSRSRAETEAAAVVAWSAAVLGAAAGLGLVDASLPEGPALAAGGAGLLLAGSFGLVGLGAGRALLVPSVVVGAALTAAGVLTATTGADPVVVLVWLLAVAVAAGSTFPGLALGLTASTGPPADRSPEEPVAVDPDRVAADAAVARELLLGMNASLGLLLVLVAPLAVSRGLSGTSLGIAACLLVVLRSRRYVGRSEVLVGQVSGVVALAGVVTATLWLHPDWRPVIAFAVPAVGCLLVLALLASPVASPRRHRLEDAALSVAALALLPLLVPTTGLLAMVRG